MGKNPVAFRTLQVTCFSTLLFAALIVLLICFHHIVPAAPSLLQVQPGVNLTEAWLDLKELSNGFHPFNSRRNDEVHDFLLLKIESILKRNNASFITDPAPKAQLSGLSGSAYAASNSSVIVYNDLVSNATFSSNNITIYFEGTNIIVHVVGEEESPTSGVLVNAHYDSVSTGYGVTDDGMGVITILQLISYFTTAGNKPKRGLVFLLNNGEEDYLNGAYVFMQHPISQYPHIFLNLEGAGAGGKPLLFRTTDTEVTKFFRSASHPFGSSIVGDGFNSGFVRSQTDYVVFNGLLGLRGLDLAFFDPRSRYHTIEDSTKFDSLDSMWNMLSSSLSTVRAMASDTSQTFDGEPRKDGKVNSGSGSTAVWFDLFSRGFAVLQLHTLFALSVTLLVVTPVILIALTALLARLDRWYLFSRNKKFEGEGQSVRVPFNGWKGFFRYPVAFIVSTAAVIGLAFLQTKINPYMIYGNEYAIWSMFLSAWLVFEWFILYGAYQMRPTALSRMFGLLWIYIGAYILVVANTVAENNFQLGGGYPLVFYLATAFFALLISYLEMFALPTKEKYTYNFIGPNPFPAGGPGPSSGPRTEPSNEDTEAEDEATERTSLLRGDRQTFGRGYGSRQRSTENDAAAASPTDEVHPAGLPEPYSGEQEWSGKLSKWTWLLQLLLLAFNVILVGQIALILTTALHQTPADGNPVLTIYLFFALLTILLLTPLRPFLHKVSIYVPLFLFLVLAGTMIYNLTAFPFSNNAKLKVYFIQRVDLDSKVNTVSLIGIDGYVQPIIAELPSAAGQPLNCTSPELASRKGLAQCSWTGLAPDVMKGSNPWLPPGIPPEYGYDDWLNYTVKRVKNDTAAVFNISSHGTRACKITFAKPVSAVNVTGGAFDERLPPVSEHGCTELRLWHRGWEDSWEVTVRWDDVGGAAGGKGGDGLDGRVICLWSDANTPGVIPALDEVWRFMPAWAMVTKAGDGLVEASKAFVV